MAAEKRVRKEEQAAGRGTGGTKTAGTKTAGAKTSGTKAAGTRPAGTRTGSGTGRAPKKRLRKEEPHVHLLTWILLILANLAAITVLIAVNCFTVKNVRIENNELYDDSVITDAILNDDYSWNVLYVYAKYQFTTPDEIPFVASMDVSMADRNTLVISVNEKALLGYIYLKDEKKNAYFDVDGYVTEISDRLIEDVPEIKGLDCQDVTEDEQLPVSDSKRKNLLAVTQALKRNNLVPDTVTYGTDHEPQLTFGQVTVVVGSTTGLSQKIERLAAILPTLTGKTGTLHLENWSEQTTDIIFDDESAADSESAQSAADAQSTGSDENAANDGSSAGTQTSGDTGAGEATGSIQSTGNDAGTGSSMSAGTAENPDE